MNQKIKVLMMPDYRIDNPFQHLLEQAISKNQVEVIFAKGYKRIFPVFRQIRMYPDVQLLHLHWISPFLKGRNTFSMAVYALKFVGDILLTRLSGIPIVWTIHNQVSHDAQFPSIEIFVRRITSKLVNAAILHGDSLKTIIIHQYKIKASKLSIINLGNYRDVYPKLIDQSRAREQWSIVKDAKKVFLHQGMLKPYKGIEDLIEAWNNDYRDSENLLIIAGKAQDAAYESLLTSLIAGAPNIKFIPSYVTDEEITSLYSACDVVVLPFKKIMASSSLMVAISFGKPVIAPRLGACEELLGNADDLLYNPDDKEGLKKALAKSQVIDLFSLGEKTKVRADFYNWDDIGLMTANLYKSVLKK